MAYIAIIAVAALALTANIASAAQDYNSSRSNNEAVAAPANHNTTRSNRTQPANDVDPDSDDDSVDEADTTTRGWDPAKKETIEGE